MQPKQLRKSWLLLTGVSVSVALAAFMTSNRSWTALGAGLEQDGTPKVLTPAAQAQAQQPDQTQHLGIRLPEGTALMLVDVLQLRPTQLAVGMQQVQFKMDKAKRKADKGADTLDRFLQHNPIPVIKGPGGALYMIDHHHQALALHRLGIKQCYVGIASDMSHLAPDAFWGAMEQQHLLWPYTAAGQEVAMKELPSLLPLTVEGLADDPYRSLASLVRKSGGYIKSSRPFSEFIWGNFLRQRVPMEVQSPKDVATYVPAGLKHAASKEAERLPGYCAITASIAQQLASAAHNR